MRRDCFGGGYHRDPRTFLLYKWYFHFIITAFIVHSTLFIGSNFGTSISSFGSQFLGISKALRTPGSNIVSPMMRGLPLFKAHATSSAPKFERLLVVLPQIWCYGTKIHLVGSHSPSGSLMLPASATTPGALESATWTCAHLLESSITNSMYCV